mmetsp:Transcript_1509/g.4486  ORF Transcript_1509/g.4486 Transcript_1509/m.4486 type:complete len:98 (-) Transcript_1509:164-457(-)
MTENRRTLADMMHTSSRVAAAIIFAKGVLAPLPTAAMGDEPTAPTAGDMLTTFPDMMGNAPTATDCSMAHILFGRPPSAGAVNNKLRQTYSRFSRRF